MPLTSISIAPPAALDAKIACVAPLISSPVADWVSEMPPVPPVCVSESAGLPASTSLVSIGVSAFSVTSRSVAPLALSDCDRLIGSAPEQVNTPLPDEVSPHVLVKYRTRSKLLAATSCTNR